VLSRLTFLSGSNFSGEVFQAPPGVTSSSLPLAAPWALASSLGPRSRDIFFFHPPFPKTYAALAQESRRSPSGYFFLQMNWPPFFPPFWYPYLKNSLAYEPAPHVVQSRDYNPRYNFRRLSLETRTQCLSSVFPSPPDSQERLFIPFNLFWAAACLFPLIPIWTQKWCLLFSQIGTPPIISLTLNISTNRDFEGRVAVAPHHSFPISFQYPPILLAKLHRAPAHHVFR